MTLSPDDVVTRSPDQVFAEVERELLMLHVDSGRYFVTNPIGTEVWERIEHPTRISDLCGHLQRRFDVTADRCTADVLAFLAALHERGLVTVAG